MNRPEDYSSDPNPCLLKPGTLWDRLKQQTQHAIATGALHSIPTECDFVEQSGIRFLVRTVANLTRKDEAKRRQEKATEQSGKSVNPFLPYDPDLFVADISPTHLCLLNKFNVVDYHLLIVTREFEEQDELLNERDFAALWLCLRDVEGLAFYNGGTDAGASQRHKHLQVVPLPFAEGGPPVPIQPAIAAATLHNGIGQSAILPYLHAIAPLSLEHMTSTQQAADQLLSCYRALFDAVGQPLGPSTLLQPIPYNLLVTREWMLLVPRSQDSFDGIAVNSLGFSGALLVRNDDQMQYLKQQGPLTLLQQVGQPR